jgi:transposase InsO family protein
VLDDSSRFILAWDLKAEQTAEAISEVVQQAVEWTGMPAAPVESRARLLTDPGSGYLAAAFENYLRAHHPQTNGKLERVHETLKAGRESVPKRVLVKWLSASCRTKYRVECTPELCSLPGLS